MRKYSILILTLIMCLLLTSCATMRAVMYDPNAKVEEKTEEVVEDETKITDDETSNSPSGTTTASKPPMIITVPLMVISLGLTILCLIAQWKLFVKAGEKGWKCLVPILNMWTMFKITYGEGIKMFLTWIPIVGIIFLILFIFDFAEAYGKGGTGFKLGLVLLAPIFFTIMGLSKKIQYVGPKVKK